MKRIATLYPFLLLALTLVAHAQPQVSYITPDIGAAGMNTYVEVIGPTATTGNFGADGVYLNAPSDVVRIIPVTPSDTNNVVLGPLVVSWNGRMISTQIFVRPNAPNSIINLQVVVNGRLSNVVPFEIVTPQTLGTLTGGGSLGSGGTFGTRSKRGAMIVQGLTLQSGTFTVSTTDPDNLTAGNQGFLPFILLSKGPIRIQSGASLNVNGSGNTGGAGGGGGGGSVVDAITGGVAPSGGDGYSGGGGGSVNRTGTAVPGIPGNGTGPTPSLTIPTTAMNGAPGGMGSAPCAENAGGGTGHPFGTGGAGSCPGVNFTTGGYGGGSGAIQQGTGGGGGYSGVGGNGGLTGNNSAVPAGKVHGNDMGVPVAGGSGGASGNPQVFPGGTSGYGGGGGGAIVLYSMADIANAGSVDAKGANGGIGTTTTAGNGGSGSGGFVELGTKVRSSAGGSANVSGGAASSGLGAGGAGRIRADGFTTLPTAPGGGSKYAGPSIDSLTFVQSRIFTLQGTYSGVSGVGLRVYMKNDNSPGWALLGAPTTSGSTWSLSFTAAAGSGNYYFVVMQQVPSNATGQYTAEPSWVLSQAAANIIKVDLTAKINTDKATDTFTDLECETERTDSVKVFNTGDDVLRVTPSLALGTQGFTILPPMNAPFVLAPDSSVYIKIRFVPTAPGVKSDTLVLANNDKRAGMNPKKVPLVAKKLNIHPYFDQTEFDFGDVCRDSTITRSIWLHYQGDVPATFQQVTRVLTGQSNFTLLPVLGLPRTMNSGDSIQLQVTFHPSSAGLSSDQFQALIGPCNQLDTFGVKGNGTLTQVTITPDTIKFGDVRISTTSTQTFKVINSGTVMGKITQLILIPPDPAFKITGDPTGTTLVPTQQVPGTITFTPSEAKSYQVQILAVIDGLCPDTSTAVVTGRGVTSMLFFSRRDISISADPCNDPAPPTTDTLTLFNLGTASAKIDGLSSVHGLVGVTTTPSLPVDLQPGDSIKIRISWTPTSAGTFTDSLRLTTESEDPKQREIFTGLTLIREKWASGLAMADGSALPAVVDLGNVYKCTVPVKFDLSIKNAGTVNDTATVTLLKGSEFTLTPSASTYAVDSAASKSLSVTFNSLTQGTYRDTLVYRSLVCNKVDSVPFVATFFSLDYNAPDIDFGKKNVGLPSVKPVSVTNTSTTPNNVRYHIIAAEIQPPTAPFVLSAPISYPQEIAPGESFSQNVTFTPPAIGDYSAELWYIIDTPCPDTIRVQLKGKGIQSNVLVQPSALNFGTKYVCQDDSTLLVTIKNTGTAPFQLQQVTIDGVDQAAYEVTKVPSPLPQPVASGTIDTVLIHFMPSLAGGDGLLHATLHVITDDTTNPDVMIDLVGERRRQLLTTPTNLDFGYVEVGESDTLVVTLDNRTADSLKISNLSIDPPFEIIDQITPVTIGPIPDSIRIRIRFTPTDSVQTTVPLIVAETSPCPDTTRLMVTGHGKITPVGIADIVIPLDVTGKAGDRIAIPIIMEKTAALDQTGSTTFIAKIRFDRTMLIPIGARSKDQRAPKATATGSIATGQMLDTVTVGSDKIVTVRIENTPMPLQPDTLGYLDAFVLLGDAVSTPLAIDTLYWTQGTVKGTKRDGLFTLKDYCDQGSDRLIRISDGFGIKAAVPNPFNPSTEIHFQTVESGATTLAIYDTYGRVVELLIDRQNLPIAEHSITWSAGGASSGLYYAVLITPTQRSVYPLMLVK